MPCTHLCAWLGYMYRKENIKKKKIHVQISHSITVDQKLLQKEKRDREREREGGGGRKEEKI